MRLGRCRRCCRGGGGVAGLLLTLALLLWRRGLQFAVDVPAAVHGVGRVGKGDDWEEIPQHMIAAWDEG